MNVGNSATDVLRAIWLGRTYNTVNLVEQPPFHAEGCTWEGEAVRIGNPLKLQHWGGRPLDLDRIDKRTRNNSDISAQIAILAAREMVLNSFKDGQIPDDLVSAVVTGCSIGGSLQLLKYNDLYLENLADGRTRRALAGASTVVLPGQAAAFTANDLDARGPREIVSSECDSGIAALKGAISSVTTRQDRIGRMDPRDPRATDAQFVIVGTSEVSIKPIAYRIFDSVLTRGALSRRNDDPETASRPWDAEANGFVFGEGSIQFGLQTLAQAKESGNEDRILGEVLSVAHVSDPTTANPIFPNESAISGSMTLALARAGLEPHNIDGIHAHATSTGQSEITESAAIKTVFGDLTETGKIPTISTKSIIGHPLSNAAMVGVMVALEAIRIGEFPPNWNLFNINPRVADIWLPREHTRKTYDAVMVNAQGFGGSNGSAIIARYVG